LRVAVLLFPEGNSVLHTGTERHGKFRNCLIQSIVEFFAPSSFLSLVNARRLLFQSGMVFSTCFVMTLKQYKGLSEEYQEHILKHKAVVISTVRAGDELYTLFQVYGFYLEICSYENCGPVISTIYFEGTDLLEPYLGPINIASVYEVLNSKK
jgi:hypothetical protein